jgi:hypothetical protein
MSLLTSKPRKPRRVDSVSRMQLLAGIAIGCAITLFTLWAMQ